MTFFAPAFEGLAAITALLVFVAAWLILQAWRGTFGRLIDGVVSWVSEFGIPTFFGTISIGAYLVAPLGGVNGIVEGALGLVVTSTEWAWHKLFHTLASTIIWIGQSVAYDMHEVGKAFGVLRRTTIPALISDAVQVGTHPIRFIVGQLRSDLHAAERAISADVAAVTSEAHTLEREALARLGHVESDAAGAASAAIAVVLPGLHGLERDVSGIQKWIKEHERLLTKAGIAGLVAGALAELGLGSQSCANNKKFTKSVCGLSSKVLDDLLAGLVAIVGSVSLLQFAEEYQKLVPGLTSEIRTFWRVTSGTAAKDRALGQSGF